MRSDTKRRQFTREVKKLIAERDSIQGWPCCVYCGAAAPDVLSWSNAHYISRGQNGSASVKNGLTLCPQCHRRYDQTTERMAMRAFFRDYLKSKYDDWNEEDLYIRRHK